MKQSLKEHLSCLNPGDMLVVVHSTVLSLLILFRYSAIGPEAMPYLMKFLAVLFLAAVVAPALDRIDHPLARNPLVVIARNVYPMTLLGAFYYWSYPVSRMFFDAPIDPLLQSADTALFGFDPAKEFSVMTGNNLFVTEWMYVSYLSFYWVSLYLPFYLYFSGRMKDYFYVIFTSGLVIFFCFLCHAIVPSRGPIYFDPATYGHVFAGPVSRIAAHFMSFADIPGAAMPSGHIAGTLVVLALAWKFARKAFWFTLPVALSLCVATVYCRYHYAVDGIASVVIVAGGLLASKHLYPVLFPRYQEAYDDDTRPAVVRLGLRGIMFRKNSSDTARY